MIIKLQAGIAQSELECILATLERHSYKGTEVKTSDEHYLVAIGSKPADLRTFGKLAGVKDVFRVDDAYKLVSRQWRVKRTVIDLGDGVTIGDGTLALMAGPCSIESEEQVRKTARYLKSQGVRIMRGGAFKPRTSPYSFRGLGYDGLKLFYDLAREHGIKVITEVMDAAQIPGMYDYVDIFQVGARNTQNFSLLDELGKVRKPVLLKRGISGTLDELLQSAEYVFSGGNEKVLLCERGIRTFEKAYRNTLDINAVPVLRDKSHLPVIVDPSHGIGIRKFVQPVALAAVAAGADGLLVEIHEAPEEAMSDGDQTLSFEEAGELFSSARRIFAATRLTQEG